MSRLDEIKARMNAATPGPWIASHEWDGNIIAAVTTGWDENGDDYDGLDVYSKTRNQETTQMLFLSPTPAKTYRGLCPKWSDSVS